MPEPDDDDAEYDNIIADYAAGHDVADIEERYHVTRAEIEWLVAEDARYEADDPAPGSAAMPEPEDDDAEYDNIIADYAAGHDVADIEKRYHVTRAQIEWLVAGNAPHEAHRAAPGSAPSATPPVPVLIAVVLLGLETALPLVGIVAVAPAGAWALAACAMPVIAVNAAAAYGLRRGWRGAQVVTVVFGAMLLVNGVINLGFSGVEFGFLFWLAVVGAAPAVLVLVPASARAWFAR
ncbi:hypothetical protein WEI85_26700 [Actinomycetes bacterium KLBMP 9797]